jgi:hypothetical protein
MKDYTKKRFIEMPKKVRSWNKPYSEQDIAFACRQLKAIPEDIVPFSEVIIEELEVEVLKQMYCIYFLCRQIRCDEILQIQRDAGVKIKLENSDLGLTPIMIPEPRETVRDLSVGVLASEETEMGETDTEILEEEAKLGNPKFIQENMPVLLEENRTGYRNQAISEEKVDDER